MPDHQLLTLFLKNCDTVRRWHLAGGSRSLESNLEVYSEAQLLVLSPVSGPLVF